MFGFTTHRQKNNSPSTNENPENSAHLLLLLLVRESFSYATTQATKHFPNHRLHRYALVVVQAVHVEWVLQQSGWFLTTTMMMKKSHPLAIDGLPGLDAIFYLCH